MKTVARALCGICFFLLLFFGCGDIENNATFLCLVASLIGLGVFGTIGGVIHGLDYDE